MAAITFDTLKFFNRLKQAGVPPAQAEAEAEALAEVFETNTAELATKQDLREYESAIRNDLGKLETGLRNDLEKLETGLRNEIKFSEERMSTRIAEIKFDLLKWVIGIALAQVGLLVGILVKLL